MLDQEPYTAAAVAELILCDPALTLRVLIAAERDGSSVERAPVDVIATAVDVLGRDLLRALAFVDIGRELRTANARNVQWALERTWARSLLVAELAGRLAAAAGQPAAPAHLAGLLQQIGKLALLRARGDAYLRLLMTLRWDAELLRAEQTEFATAHDVAGAEALEASDLSALTAEAARFAHQPPEHLADAPVLVRAVRVACMLAERGSDDEARGAARNLIGIDGETTDRLLEESRHAAHARGNGLVAFESERKTALQATEQALIEHDLALAPGTGGISNSNGAMKELIGALARSGERQILRQACADTTSQDDALTGVRRLVRLLTGLRRHVFLLATADRKRLIGTPLRDDSDVVSKLGIALAASSSVIARAAVELRPTRAADTALEQGMAIDRVVARMLRADALLCLPLVHERVVVGVLVLGRAEPGETEALLQHIATIAAEALLRVARRSGGEERMRIDLTERFRAAGKRIVHEVGNPLAIVKNYLTLIGDKAAEKGQLRDELSILNEELDRVSRIVRRMGDPLAVELEEPARLDLNALVSELMTLCKGTLFSPRNIDVVQQLDAHVPLLRAEVGAVKQIVINVLTNAAEAMPNGGRLGVMTADSVNIGGELYVLLQISDSGGGVPPDVMQRLFKSDTTTKGAGHEGIGLAVTASILKRLGGQIICRSSVGRGTIFLVLLPRRLFAAPEHNNERVAAVASAVPS